MKRLLVQSHRGGGVLAPENTLESFIGSWELGAVPEADLRTTQDNVIIAFHDPTIARVVKDSMSDLKEKKVRDMTFQELAVLDVGSWKDDSFAGQRISSMEQVFSLMREQPERMLYMDIKDVHLPQLAELVGEFNVANQVILAAPDESLLREWQTLVPNGQTLLWMGIPGGGDEATLRGRLARLRNEAFAGITQLQIHIEMVNNEGCQQFKPSVEFLRAAAAELQSCGVLFQAFPWECADPQVYRTLLEAGVQSFASDHPEIALQVLRDWIQSG